MRLKERVREAGSYFALLLTVAGLAVGYLGLTKTDNPEITIRVVSQSAVFDIYKPIEDLQVVFKGKDLRQERKSLRSIVIEVLNSGDVNFKEGDFDPQDPWGIEIDGGDVTSAVVSRGSSAYLARFAGALPISNGTINLPRMMLDRGASFTVEVLVLHQQGGAPRLKARGKVSGINDMKVVETDMVAQRTLLGRVFEGGAVVNIIRATAFFLLPFGTLVGWVAIADRYDRRKSRNRDRQRLARRAIAQDYINQNSASKEDGADLVLDAYVDKGPNGLKEMLDFLDDAPRLEKELKILEAVDDFDSRFRGLQGETSKAADSRFKSHLIMDVPGEGSVVLNPAFMVSKLTIASLKSRGFITTSEDGKPIIDANFRSRLAGVIDYLKSF